MRRKRLHRLAGELVGHPETVGVFAIEEAPPAEPMRHGRVMRAVNDRAEHRPRRNGWVTAAAVILLIDGGLGVLYLPVLLGGDLGSFLGLGILIVGVAVLSIAAGIGLLRLYRWARLTAGAVAVFALVFMYAPALGFAVSRGVWFGIDWLGAFAHLLILFAVVRRWPSTRGARPQAAR